MDYNTENGNVQLNNMLFGHGCGIKNRYLI